MIRRYERIVMKNAYDYGFSPEKTPRENAEALQEAVKGGGEIVITVPGSYDLDKTVILESNTTLKFAEGVYLRRIPTEGYGYTFINAGAYTRVYDENIQIYGLNIICNGHDYFSSSKGDIPGLRGMVSFFYINNLMIKDFTCPDLESKGFCIHICTFENISVENVHIEGKKDGVHLGRGKNFVIKNGLFRTFDDPIALNAHDYATSNPQLGWIENGLIENCYDLDDDSTTGFFCRILAGSWGDWFEGMTVQHSDTVVCNGRLYRVIAKPDGTFYKSLTPPSHSSGVAEYDGINWCMVQDDEVIYNCGCRNVTFKKIHLCKHRPVAFSIHFDDDRWSRSVYPNSDMPTQENIVFDDIRLEIEVESMLWTVSPAKNIVFKNIKPLKPARFSFGSLKREGLEYPISDITFDNVELCGSGAGEIYCADNRRVELTVKASAATEPEGFKLKIDKNVSVTESNIPTEIRN